MGERRQSILLILMIMALLILLMTSGCDPGSYLTVDNRTDQTVEIFIENLNHVDVPPRQVVNFGTMEIWPESDPPWGTEDYKYLIEAKTKQGEIIYSEEFTWQELDGMDWTIVIPPSQNN